MIHLPSIYDSTSAARVWDTAVTLHDGSDQIIDHGRVVDVVDWVQVVRDCGKAHLTNPEASCEFP